MSTRNKATITRFKRIYVTHYSDNGQTFARVEHDLGTTVGVLARRSYRKGAPATFTFGEHMHALFNAARRQGLKLEREHW